MKDTKSELLELGGMVILLILLILFARLLAHLGVFDPLPLTRQPQPPLLLALAPLPATHAGHHPLMDTILSAAAARGVTEESQLLGTEDSQLLGTPSTTLARGQSIGIFSGPVHPLAKFPALVGAILDTGEDRVTSAAQREWASRLEPRNIDGLQIRILMLNDSLCVPAFHGGRASEWIGVWRVYRKLVKRWNRVPERRGQPNVILHAFSAQHKRSIAVLPVDCTVELLQA
eukprot:GFKZ01004847.1.p1 GENE.GFKZ01004847.1~~GFKZ01004847.1.p1  ORF type:complete len:238 (+),score=16.28 GFKZ01004847.1:24-716(+)